MSEARVMTGRLKWYNSHDGVGFFSTPDGDVKIRHDELKRTGIKSPLCGTTITASCVRGRNGLQATHIIRLDEGTAERETNGRDRGVAAESPWVKASVKWFDYKNGFGFVSVQGQTKDVFVHQRTLRRFAIRHLQTGDVIEIRYGHHPKGLEAVELREVVG